VGRGGLAERQGLHTMSKPPAPTAPESKFAIGDWRRAFADADGKPVDDEGYLWKLRRSLEVIDPQHSDLRIDIDTRILSVSLRNAGRIRP
jgi:hypothetical protein